MKRRLTAVCCVIVLLLTSCGGKGSNSNVTLQETTKYEHIVVPVKSSTEPKDEQKTVKDADGYTLVQDTIYVTSNTLNIRSLPNSESEVIKTVSYGTPLLRTGIGEKGWDRVFYDDQTAYVYNQYTTSLTIQENRTFEYVTAMLSIVDTTKQIYRYDSVCEDLSEMKARYGEHMRLNCIGSTRDNRNIFEIVIGNPETAKKNIFICGGICGAEYMSSLLCMRQAEYCLCYYDSGNYNGFAYSELFENVAIHVIPMLNPDGISISQDLLSKVQDPAIVDNLKKWQERDQTQGGTSLTLDNYLMYYYANANGVDLRKNFPYHWDDAEGGVTQPGSVGYRGDRTGSEAETKALIRQLTGITPDLVVTYHTSGAKIRYNYGQSEPMLSTCKKYAERLAEVMNYEVDGSAAGISGYGSYEGYCCFENDIPVLNVALGNGTNPLNINEFGSIWNACRESWAVLQLAVIDY